MLNPRPEADIITSELNLLDIDQNFPAILATSIIENKSLNQAISNWTSISHLII